MHDYSKSLSTNDHLVVVLKKNQESLESLTGRNPYHDFAAYGAELQKLEIYIRSEANDRGKILTGRAWFYGRIHSFGVNSYEEMISSLVNRLNEHYEWIHQNQTESRRRYRERWEARHPGSSFPWAEKHRELDASPRRFFLGKEAV